MHWNIRRKDVREKFFLHEQKLIFNAMIFFGRMFCWTKLPCDFNHCWRRKSSLIYLHVKGFIGERGRCGEGGGRFSCTIYLLLHKGTIRTISSNARREIKHNSRPNNLTLCLMVPLKHPPLHLHQRHQHTNFTDAPFLPLTLCSLSLNLRLPTDFPVNIFNRSYISCFQPSFPLNT